MAAMEASDDFTTRYETIKLDQTEEIVYLFTRVSLEACEETESFHDIQEIQ